jgi:uncharacterized protein (TIGR02301 family)
MNMGRSRAKARSWDDVPARPGFGLELCAGNGHTPPLRQTENHGSTAVKTSSIRFAGKHNVVMTAVLLAAVLSGLFMAPESFAAPQGSGGGQQGGSAPAQQAPAAGQSGPMGVDDRPYDAQLMRLAELLGSVHYLRELCGGNDGQAWRSQMKELVASEGSTALRRARLVESFNKGYRSYARTYRSCTQPALTAIGHFMEQGATVAESLADQNK